MKLKALCASFLVLSCVFAEIKCITNQEFFDLVKYYAEDLEALDSSGSSSTIVDSDDDVIELPGNGDDDLDIPYLLTKIDLSDSLNKLESLEPADDDEDEDNADDWLDDDNDGDGYSKHDEEDTDAVSTDTFDDFENDPITAPDNDVTVAQTDGQVPDGKEGDEDVENLINKLDPSHAGTEFLESDLLNDISENDGDEFDSNLNEADTDGIGEEVGLSPAKDIKPFDKPLKERVGWFRRVIRIFRKGRRIIRRSSRRYRTRRSRSRRRSRRRYSYRGYRRRTRHRMNHRLTTSKSSSRQYCHVRLQHMFKMSLKPTSVRFRIHACLNLAYLPLSDGIAFTLSNNNGQLFHKEISLRSPPALCFPVPYLKKIAHACIETHKPNSNEKNMCLRLSANVDLKVKKYRFLVNLWCGHISSTFAEEGRNGLLQTMQASVENEETGQFEYIPLYDLPFLYQDLKDKIEKRKYNSVQDETESTADGPLTLLFEPET